MWLESWLPAWRQGLRSQKGQTSLPLGAVEPEGVQLSLDGLCQVLLPGCVSTAVCILHSREPSKNDVELCLVEFCIRAQTFAVKPHSAKDRTGQWWSERGSEMWVLSSVKLWTYLHICKSQ